MTKIVTKLKSSPRFHENQFWRKRWKIGEKVVRKLKEEVVDLFLAYHFHPNRPVRSSSSCFIQKYINFPSTNTSWLFMSFFLVGASGTNLFAQSRSKLAIAEHLPRPDTIEVTSTVDVLRKPSSCWIYRRIQESRQYKCSVVILWHLQNSLLTIATFQELAGIKHSILAHSLAIQTFETQIISVLRYTRWANTFTSKVIPQFITAPVPSEKVQQKNKSASEWFSCTC